VTALSQPPGRLLSISDYAALSEDDRNRWELQEGNLVLSPSPTPRHMVIAAELYVQLRGQLPGHLRAVPDVDLDVQLAPADQPGTARRPDLVVVQQAEFDRVAETGGLLRAASTVLVVEIVSPGSRRTDNLVKRGEYADAGIPFYWLVWLSGDHVLSIDVHVLDHTLGYYRLYRTLSPEQETSTIDVPIRIQIDWNRLAHLVRQ
jgi:Uma2 family endonuclease